MRSRILPRRRDLIAAAFLAALPCAPPAFAALAPNYERLRELAAILASPELAQKLGNDVVEGIEAGADHTYRVWTAKCSLVVTLVDAASGPPMPGAWQFAIKVGDPQCR
ncbi:MAG TPA: hypothetical protein VFA12_06205 [Stellaceae bacterium]|nr:hypothetical protein [Stellaceae bacterium]